MEPEMTIDYLGDDLFEINGNILNLDQIATNIVAGQDGDTVDRLVREHSGKTCEYHGDGIWDFDGKKKDEDEMSELMSEILHDLDEPLLVETVENYFTPA